MHCYSDFTLCRGHYSITSPAEIWELLEVITEAHWSGIWCGAILHLKLQLMESGEIVAWCWLCAFPANYIFLTPTLSRLLITGHVNGTTYITLTTLTTKIILFLGQEETILTGVTHMPT